METQASLVLHLGRGCRHLRGHALPRALPSSCVSTTLAGRCPPTALPLAAACVGVLLRHLPSTRHACGSEPPLFPVFPPPTASVLPPFSSSLSAFTSLPSPTASASLPTTTSAPPPATASAPPPPTSSVPPLFLSRPPDDFYITAADFSHIATLFLIVTDDCICTTTAGDHVCTTALLITTDVGADTDAQHLVAAGDDRVRAAADDILHSATLPFDLSTSRVLGSSTYCTITRLHALLHLALRGRATRARDHVRHLLGECVLAGLSSLRLNCPPLRFPLSPRCLVSGRPHWSPPPLSAAAVVLVGAAG
ncbi:hypothetical protein PF005_g24510 [Phytophthora fragariae]|uniref:Uncharacterized protein n=1 Tax=Phytophthora fragariae TaxID=53985 RepID=A0A6A3QJC9_9STRA|nr:hypothetical protein PF007_g24518 [Phytophthora fragariae]KAE9177398.1 hypothetical protein PF005_g24510 [Phytophthora fragariae]